MSGDLKSTDRRQRTPFLWIAAALFIGWFSPFASDP